jgi:predicted regulator of Ras-like GTPase activity (Roadblock/LC7/MglB family)
MHLARRLNRLPNITYRPAGRHSPKKSVRLPKVISLTGDHTSKQIKFYGIPIRGEAMAKLEALQKNIETLRAAIPELRGVLIASTEGLPVAHSIAGGADPARVAAMADRIAAMAAAAVNLGKRVSESLSVGALVEISVTGAEGQIFLYSAGTKGVLAVIAPKGGNSGLVHLEARAVAKDVGDLF